MSDSSDLSKFEEEFRKAWMEQLDRQTFLGDPIDLSEYTSLPTSTAYVSFNSAQNEENSVNYSDMLEKIYESRKKYQEKLKEFNLISVQRLTFEIRVDPTEWFNRTPAEEKFFRYYSTPYRSYTSDYQIPIPPDYGVGGGNNSSNIDLTKLSSDELIAYGNYLLDRLEYELAQERLDEQSEAESELETSETSQDNPE